MFKILIKLFVICIYILCLSVWVSVCFLNVKIAEPIRTTFYVGSLMTIIKIWKFASNKIRIAKNLKKSTILFIKSANVFVFCFTMYKTRKYAQLKKWAWSALKALFKNTLYIYFCVKNEGTDLTAKCKSLENKSWDHAILKASREFNNLVLSRLIQKNI